eukprot:CAMPEP_0115165530 /NCGR_PEP_ID=MMETSP0227-20121206/73643_1 /TAXON_ID=89957 /ORGANISM="Polarella glacialis, Strain CCMP 1383" /LENGTH=887 /DNA_ID=CAMNT_0002578011 /DNA_START=120 /DNA_END=2783 /DNA_ORIENTATION=+
MAEMYQAMGSPSGSGYGPVLSASAVSGLGLCLPGVSCRGTSERGASSPQGYCSDASVFAPPTATPVPTATLFGAAMLPGVARRQDGAPPPPTHTQVEAPRLGIPSRQPQEASVQPGPMLGIPSRHQAAMLPIGRQPINEVAMLPIGREPVQKVKYFLESPSTPLASRKSTGPVPLSSLRSNSSFGDGIERQQSHQSDGMGDLGMRPVHRKTSRSSESGDPILWSPSTSFSSSINSATRSHLPTAGSFKWAPEHALVQCWHKSLSETYRDYNMVNIVGEGRHGVVVFIVQHKLSDQHYACKLLNKVDNGASSVRKEMENLRMMDHPNIVRLYEVNEDKEAVFLLMEYCSGGDLFSLITDSDEGYLPEHLARIFTAQMLSALAYCHSKGIVHRDVKPENFLLENQDPNCTNLKLADFGIATSVRCVDGESEGQVDGSIPYMAPELFSRRWKSLVKDSKGDVALLAAGDLWSAGVVIYVMLSGNLPYGKSPQNICSGDPPDFSAKVWEEVSTSAKDLITRLLNPDTEARWTAKQALNHEWLAVKTDRNSPAEAGVAGTGRGFVDTSEGAASFFPQSRHDNARAVLRALRRWKPSHFLRRMALAGIAKRLEADNPSRKFAETAYQSFIGSHERLSCQLLVQELNCALCEVPSQQSVGSSTSTVGPRSAELLHPFQAHAADTSRSCKSSDSLRSGASMQFSPGGKTMTGLYVRQHMKHAIYRRLGRLSEDTPFGSSPVSLSPGIFSATSEDLVSLTELEILVSALDAAKNGSVDWTLFVAALIPPEVYCEESRVMEIFAQLDISGRGLIGPEDLQTKLISAVRKQDGSNLKTFVKMVKEFDLNGDGVLDIHEFRKLLGGDELHLEGDLSGTASATPMATPPSRPSPPSRTPE